MFTSLNINFNPKLWSKANFIGWLIGVVFLILFSGFLESIGIHHMQFYVGVGMGAGVGLAQWWVLRKYLQISSAWIGVTIIGMGLPFLIVDLAAELDNLIKLPVCVVSGSIVTAFLQYLLLKEKSSGARSWIGGCILGWTAALIVVSLINLTMSMRLTGFMNLLIAFLNLFLILAGGTVLGKVSGPAMKKVVEGKMIRN